MTNLVHFLLGIHLSQYFVEIRNVFKELKVTPDSMKGGWEEFSVLEKQGEINNRCVKTNQ